MDWNLPVSFYFRVNIGGVEQAFKEVSGLNTELELETVVEGGLNNYSHQLPKQLKHGNLVLKRALEPFNSIFSRWINEVMEGDLLMPVMTKNITVSLLNSEGEPLHTWSCDHAFPVKWEFGVLDAEKNSIMIETLEFSYRTVRKT